MKVDVEQYMEQLNADCLEFFDRTLEQVIDEVIEMDLDKIGYDNCYCYSDI